MKYSEKPQLVNTVSAAAQKMAQLYSRITQARGGFHTAEEERPTMLWALICALAVTDTWIPSPAKKSKSGNTVKSSNILSFSRSSDSGIKRR